MYGVLGNVPKPCHRHHCDTLTTEHQARDRQPVVGTPVPHPGVSQGIRYRTVGQLPDRLDARL